MKRTVFATLLGLALLTLAALAAGGEELTVNSILKIHQSGAPADIILTMVNNPANTIAMVTGDLVTLRNAGLPETVITAIGARITAPTASSVPLQPDDARLIDIASLIRSGMSDSIITEQVRQSGQTYKLSTNDLLYLKQNGAKESMIAALMATSAQATEVPSAAPAAPLAQAPAQAPNVDRDELVIDGLVLVKPTFLKRDREGRLVIQGDTLLWEDRRNSKENFTFETSGLREVWFTCEARASENFCYQINLKIVKGDRYRFRDIHRDKGSNAAVLKVMETLRANFPRLPYGAPDD